MTEALVYISVLFVVLAVGYAAMYRCIDHSVALRKSADDIAAALRAGERWRADVRKAVEVAPLPSGVKLRVPNGMIEYTWTTNALYRRVGSTPPVRLLDNLKTCEIKPDSRQGVTAWKWDLELRPGPRSKSVRFRPLFTFMAVPVAGQR